jgi:hypothetical protein
MTQVVLERPSKERLGILIKQLTDSRVLKLHLAPTTRGTAGLALRDSGESPLLLHESNGDDAARGLERVTAYQSFKS